MDPTQLSAARLTVDHLRSFVAVAEELNFRRAASRLYIASSPLSRRIREVESAVGAELFERDTRHVRLTPAGEILLPLAREALTRFDALIWIVRDANPTRRVVRIGIPYGVHAPDRATAFEAARHAAGDGEIQPEPGMSHGLIRRLLARELHFSLVHGTIDLSEFETLLLREEPFGVLLSARHPLAGDDSVDLSDLAGMRLVDVDLHPLPPQQARMRQFLEAAGVKGDPMLLQDPQAITAVVGSSSSLFSVFPAGAGSPCHSFFSAPDVVIRKLRGLEMTFTTLAAWLPERAASEPLVAAIVDELRRAFASSRKLASAVGTAAAEDAAFGL